MVLAVVPLRVGTFGVAAAPGQARLSVLAGAEPDEAVPVPGLVGEAAFLSDLCPGLKGVRIDLT